MDGTRVEEAGEAGREVGRVLSEALGEDLLAVYLHGSAVLGGFRWDRSDLDILALSQGALSDAQFDRVVQGLAPLRYPANGLEFTLMTAQEASQPHLSAPRFQLHQTTKGRDRDGKAVDGRKRNGDPDLVLHLAVCRERGSTIVGPTPGVSLGVIPPEVIESAMRGEIRWARDDAPPEYLVLTSARAWLFTQTHRIVSKIEAGEWAAERYAEPAVIEASLARQRGTTAATISKPAAERFAEYVMNMPGRP